MNKNLFLSALPFISHSVRENRINIIREIINSRILETVFGPCVHEVGPCSCDIYKILNLFYTNVKFTSVTKGEVIITINSSPQTNGTTQILCPDGKTRAIITRFIDLSNFLAFVGHGFTWNLRSNPPCCKIIKTDAQVLSIDHFYQWASMFKIAH